MIKAKKKKKKDGQEKTGADWIDTRTFVCSILRSNFGVILFSISFF